MKHRSAIPRSIAVLMFAGLLAGCASSPPPSFYTLSSSSGAPTDTAPARPASAIVALGPVTLPAYIDRPQIVTRDSAYAIRLADNDYWAGSLNDMLPRVLLQDMAIRLPTDRVVAFPQVGGTGFDYRIAVDVSQFDSDANGVATLAARWQIYERMAARPLLVADEVLHRQAVASGYEAGASALSATLDELATRIAQAFTSLRIQSPRPIAGS